MFTGIIEKTGTVADSSSRGGGLQIRIAAEFPGGSLVEGESVAVSGPCLTVEKVTSDGFVVFASPETVTRTTVGSFRRGSAVNLERAMAAGGRFGGHIVTGHIDGVGTLKSRLSRGDATEVAFDTPPDVARFLVAKGSVAIDGISLTVNEVDSTTFSVMVIPHTLANTTLADLRPGSRVNLEADVLARYVLTFMQRAGGLKTGGVTEEMLRNLGW